MNLRAVHQELEEYFAKKYTNKYIEFGGYFYIKPYNTITKSPMQKYFSSGKYKELNDPKLEVYWRKIKKQEFYWNIIIIVLLIVFYMLGRE